MKPSSQRIAIAEFCGWTGCADSECVWRKCQHLHKNGNVGFPEPFSTSRYPDYLNDLNAMHEAEMHCFQTPTERCQYLCILEDVADRTRQVASDHTVDSATQWACFATAAQRAEALLRTINKWTDEKEPTK